MSQPQPEGYLQLLVGRNLTRHRRSLGLTQEQFAEMVHVHRTYYGNIEQGRRNITLVSLERIAHWCGMSPIDLLKEADS